MRVLMRKKILGRVLLRVRQISLVVLIWSLFVGAIWGLYQLVFERSIFIVKHVEVEGPLQHVADGTVRELSGIKMGANIFSVDLKKVEKALESDPWVKEVAVARKIPSTIYIYVNEHQPYAILSGDSLQLVDRNGIVFKDLEGADEKDLPVITGVSSEAELSKAMDVLNYYLQSQVADYFKVSEVNFDQVKGFSITVSKYAFSIRIGFDNIPEKLERLYSMLGGISSYKTKMRYVDLNIPGKVVVKYES